MDHLVPPGSVKALSNICLYLKMMHTLPTNMLNII
ncbi:hypothetical protein BACCAP_00795 [Pseudoflavonifractor capillosus ATCC 29799]|uniref:Uncharacterized protein n=1 Tax=Pseudoflavonifractor capillosus ATCC 29799 TaxID=411467 RepID=A6NRG7_9FIRM|nr:hypothetical protein BACCAP_00795 [Pseudoflavonifractor capillosus ATCC 29799]